METFQILSDQFSHFQHLFHRWLAIFFIISSYIFDLSSSPHTWGIPNDNARNQSTGRFIPTYVGHTWADLLKFMSRTVHPHIRGAYNIREPADEIGAGSSPHTWGIPCIAWQTKTTTTVHPHIRGAYTNNMPTMKHYDGSSPHTWGILPVATQNRAARRFIPTYVGHTLGGTGNQFSVNGSSPHTWGILRQRDGSGDAVRFIPTYVGHTPATGPL